MLPVIAIVGRPNVGKSTLFNRLTHTRSALVANQSGLTRDRQYGRAVFEDRPYIVIDTGGIGVDDCEIDSLIKKQVELAIEEADVILFVVDARDGLTVIDQNLAKKLRRAHKTVYLLVNKVDGLNEDVVTAEFHQLGLGDPLPISTAHGQGVKGIMQQVVTLFPESDPEEAESGIKVAIVGKPNVGKSTLVNRILGEERVMVFDQPGTTRDSIFVPFERRGKKYTFIDTAGVRRRKKVHATIEKFSVIKTLQAIEESHVVLFVIDAREGIVDHDLKLLGHILKSGKSLLIAINKWDGLDIDTKNQVKNELHRRLTFLEFAKLHFISALHGTGVGDLFTSINRAYKSAIKEVSTSALTQLLEKAVETHQPPLVKGRRVKLRYAHSGGHNPQVIVIHGKQLAALPDSYKRYLESFYRDALHLVGTPIHIIFRTDKNPYVKDS